MSQLAIGRGHHLWRGVVVAILVTLATVGYIYREEVTYGYDWMPVFSTEKITIDFITFNVRVARTPEARFKGLTAYDSIPARNGMLFVYDEDGYYSVTAEWTRFPTDIMWMESNGTIVQIAENVQAGEPYTIRATSEARYILQMNAGIVRRHSISVGSSVNLSDLRK